MYSWSRSSRWQHHDNNARFFPRGKVRQVSLLEQGGGRLQAGDSDHRDHRDRLPPLHGPHGRFGVVVNVGIFVGIFPGLSPFLCVVATSKWPNRDHPLHRHRKSSQGPKHQILDRTPGRKRFFFSPTEMWSKSTPIFPFSDNNVQ
jgi:hypothetical protein